MAESMPEPEAGPCSLCAEGWHVVASLARDCKARFDETESLCRAWVSKSAS